MTHSVKIYRSNLIKWGDYNDNFFRISQPPSDIKVADIQMKWHGESKWFLLGFAVFHNPTVSLLPSAETGF